MNIYTTFTQKKSAVGIGGKATNLLRLERQSMNVPKWAVIPQEVLLSQLSKAQSPDEEKVFNSLIVPDDIQEELASYFGEDSASKTYAVRSSAIDEDGQDHSFAGQFETFLHVPFGQITERIKEIWKSVNSVRVQAYRKQNDIEASFGIAVIIQEMIDAEVSGVAFGMNPVSQDLNAKVISSVFGLGEGLVSGELDADTYEICEGEIKKSLADKTHAFVKDESSGGILKATLESKKANQSTLNDYQIKEIVEVLDRLKEALNTPQDIEFAYVNKEFFILQTRPITTIVEEGEYTLWDNSNIIESYPGITTPLTFSFIIKMYEHVYRQFVGILGVNEKEIEAHKDIFANTLGLVRGRVYYNLLNWYKMLAMLPGFSINAAYMEKMMGVSERFELKEDFQMGKGLAWYRIVTMIFRMIRMQRRLPKERDLFLAQLNQVMSKYGAIDFEKLPPKEIIQHYKVFEQDLLLKWKAPLINDFFAMIWFGMLEKQVQKYLPKEPNIHNDLLCGSQDIISVEPIHRSISLAKLVNDEGAASFFKSHSPEDIWKKLSSGAYPIIKAEIDSYITKFGERCVGELKLETISYSQQPELFVKVIKSYVEQGVIAKKIDANIEDDLRLNAEKKVEKALKRKPIARWWFNKVRNNARDLVSNRENLRFERTRGFGMVRRMFSALGKSWYESGYIDHPRDVFYLELNEIKKAGVTGFKDDLRENIKNRKVEFDNYRNVQEPQERFFTYGNNFEDRFIYSEEKLESAVIDLKGIGCCPGIVRKKVQVIRDPSEIDSLHGDILVTSSTDPGWVTLFPTCSGIIVERGSLLSHSAIVSREMGIPCIVSVKGLLRTLKTGDEIIMNGSTGQIQIIDETKGE